nr:hypothetical protein [Tanacetum cinerariifolium]
LEIHGAGVLHEDANQKVLRSLPSSWSQVALIMSTKPGLDTLSFDDLYNNLRVFERVVKGGHDFHEDQEVSQEGIFQETAELNGIKIIEEEMEGVDWFRHVEEDTQNFAMMAYSSSNSGSDNKSVFMNKECDLENTPVNDRYAEGMHAVPPFMTGNYMPSGPDVEIDYSKFTYGPLHISANESDSKSVDNSSSDSDSSVEPTTSMPAPVEDAPKVVTKPKVWTDAPIIEKYKSDSDDLVSNNDPHKALKDKGIVDSGCSRHMVGNKAHLADYQEFKGGSVFFGGSKRRITGKGTIKAGRLDFEDVYYVEELKYYNLFSVSQMCDKKNKVLFTDTDCLVLSPDFKLPDENQALIDESNKWHRRLGHVNFKNLNKIMKGNLVRGVPSKIFENDRTCVACQKRKQHKASCKAKTMSSVNQPLQILHMDLFGPTSAEAVNTACYVFNRVLVTKPQNKTPYELLTGRQPITSYLRPFGCHVTILNTIEQLGKFDGKSDSGFLVGYFLNSKAFRVYNLDAKRVEENLHVNFLEYKPNVARKGHAWMFDIDYLTDSMNYEPVSLKNQANKSAGPQEANNSVGTHANADQGANSKEINLHDKQFVLPIWSAYSTSIKSSVNKIGKNEKPVSLVEQIFQEELEKLKRQEKEANDVVRKESTDETLDINTNNTNLLNTVSALVSAVGPSRALNDDEPSYPDDPSMPHLEDIYASPSAGIFTNSSYDAESVVTDFNNLETTVNTRSTVHKNFEAHALVSYIQKQQRNNHKDFQHCLFACFLSQVEPKMISQALEDLPFGKKAIGTKWVYRNKKDEKRVVVINKDRLVAQGHRQEEGIDYDDVFAPAARIEAIRIFLALASYMGFTVYQMDVKSAFLYVTIDEKVYVTQSPRFVDPKFPNKVYKVVKALYGLHQASRVWYATLFTFLEQSEYRRGAIDKNLFIKQDKKDIMLVQTASTPIKTQKPLVKDEEAADVDVHLYRRLISWQCKKQTIVATSTTEAEYVAAAHCRGQGRLLEVTNTKQSKELASPKQTALGKDKSNPLIVDSLLKTIWSSMHDVIAMKHWLFQSKRLLKFNFSRYILQSLVKNLEAGVPFYMLPRFVQLLVDNQLGDISHHQDIYNNPSLTKKVFANIKRVGTGFSGVITPLFESMLVQAADDVGEAQDDVSIPTEPSTLKPHKKHKSKKQQPKAPKVPSPTPSPEHQLTLPSTDPIHTTKESLILQEIQKLEDRVDQLEEENMAFKLKSFKTIKVDIAAPVKDKEESFKKGRMTTDMDEDVQVNLEEAQAKAYNLDLQHAEKVLSMQDIDKEDAPRRRWGVIIQDPDETATSVIVHLKNDVIEQVKRREKQDNTVMRYQSLKRKPVTKAQVRKNMMVYLKNMAGFKIDFFKATPLASKVPLVDYLIHHENNKPYYKITRADGTRKLFLSFITLLKNFDRDNLETLWKIVKERFESTEPKNFSDDFLLNTFKIMFEKPNVEANMFLLVEKKYPLTHFNLRQMLDNVRLEVKEESDMSLELLREERRGEERREENIRLRKEKNHHPNSLPFPSLYRGHIFNTFDVVPCSIVLCERCTVLLFSAKTYQVIEVILVKVRMSFFNPAPSRYAILSSSFWMSSFRFFAIATVYGPRMWSLFLPISDSKIGMILHMIFMVLRWGRIINSIKNGDQPLPRVTQVSIAETSSTEQPPLKDKSMWSDQEKNIQKIDRLAISLSIQGLPNDIYSLIDSNKTTKDLWDALARHMLGSEYGEQDRKAAVLYDELNFKFLNNLQQEWKQYAIMMRQNKNLTHINIDALYNILKQNQGDVNDAMKSKKKAVVITSDPLALVAEQTKVSKRKEKVVVSSDFDKSDDELKKITTFLAKAFNRKKFYSKPTNNNLRTSSATSSANKKQAYVKSDDKKEEKKVNENKRDISKFKCYNCKKEGHFVKDCKKAKVKDYEYDKTKMLLAKKDKDEQVLLVEDHAWMESKKSSSSSDETITEIVQICLWIINSGCLKHMTGNHAFLTNFVEKFLGTVCFRNNDFAVIAGYGDVVIRSMTIKRVTSQQNGVVQRRNRTLLEAARTMLTFANLPLFLWAEAIATACFTHNRSIIHKRFDKTPYELINKRKPNIKFFHVFECRFYLLNDYDDVGKLKAKGDIGVFVGYSKDSTAFRVYNKQTRKIHESVNVNFNEISEMASKQFSLEPGLINLNNKGKSSNPIISQVEETSKKDLEDLFHNFYDEYFDASKLKKSLTMNVETSNNEGEVFHEVFESFQGESSSSSLNDDVQQSLKEAICLFLAYVAHKDFTIVQMDVKMAFLNGILKEEVYVGQPPGFVSKQYPDHVYALDKALYGLKQAPRAWYDVLSKFLIDSGF